MLLMHSGLTVEYSKNMSFWDPFWVLSVHMHIQKLNKENQKIGGSLPTAS